MTYQDRIRSVAVLGAAGKMGSGISALLLQEMLHHAVAQQDFTKRRLALIDTNPESFTALLGYLRKHLKDLGERQIVWLRDCYKNRRDLIDNAEVIEQYVCDGMTMLRTETELSGAKDAALVFEAIVEKREVKESIFTSLRELCSPECWFFSNTSSLPIGELDAAAGLNGRLIGYHFYNPPVVQKLVELIPSANTLPEIIECSQTLGKNLKKTIIPSKDIAGFIGNGHFIRDGIFGVSLMQELTKQYSELDAIATVNAITQEWLVRPMGIFQLLDYVGIDVFVAITKVMAKHIPGENFACPWLEKLLARGIKGGQFGDGSQKNGIFQYEKGKPVAVYDQNTGEYAPLAPLVEHASAALGPKPASWAAWKQLQKDPLAANKLSAYFKDLRGTTGEGALLAKRYLENSIAICDNLVGDGVAASLSDVKGVLTNGFFHLYGGAEVWR